MTNQPDDSTYPALVYFNHQGIDPTWNTVFILPTNGSSWILLGCKQLISKYRWCFIEYCHCHKLHILGFQLIMCCLSFFVTLRKVRG